MSECGAACQGEEDNFRRNSSAKQRFTIPESSITLRESAPNFRDEFAVDSLPSSGESCANQTWSLAACSGDRVQGRLAGLDITLPQRNMAPGPVTLAVRPEAIRLYRPAGPLLPARRVKAVYLGSHMENRMDCALGALFVIDRTISESYTTSSGSWICFDHNGVTILSG